MPIADHDPRVFFAAERTLLAFGFFIAAAGLILAVYLGVSET